MAGRRQNVGPIDRIIRALLTPVVVAAAIWMFYSISQEPIALAGTGVLAVLAFVLGTSAAIGTCGVYSVFDIDTCVCEPAYDGGDRWGVNT